MPSIAGRSVFLLVALCGTPLRAQTAPPADLVLRHGTIYTMSASRGWAEAVAISGSRLVFVGADRDVAPYVGPKTRVVDLAGRFVLPGFHDSHVHLVSGGIELGQCDLNGAKTGDEVLARVKACAAAKPNAPWIIGGGWDLPLFPQANPHKRLLDEIVPDRPVYLSAADGHSTWVNSKALALAGITRETPDPPRGRIERDAEGNPTGTLREAAADLMDEHLPETTAADRTEGLRRAVERAHGFGIVSVQEASAGAESLATFRALDAAGELNLRVVVANYVDPEKGTAQVADFLKRRDDPAGKAAPHVRASAAKIFADGVIESGTAALLAPYLGERGKDGWRGELEIAPERFAEIATALDAAGFQIHVHAIGDRAIRTALDALKEARNVNGPRDARPLLAHIQLFDPADIPRFRRLGVIADFQPLWAFADPYIVDLTEPQLGPERSRWLYPMGSLFRSGAVIAAGSDWSVSSLDPLQAIEAATTRCDPDAAACPKPWIPEERVDLPTILAAYTIGGAFANFEEKDSGSLEAGKLADLIVLDHNLFEIPATEISEAKVLTTMFEGRLVYGNWSDLTEAPR
ncbi:MAG TPA: amidohydrolase [Thermoanaerobaculia bacterium]|jgi:predicted amidohydrolase YtcJ|nr:amidohydrolase [Thermoanaerobaculia bacterium]